ncbi:MAG: ATP-binding cassette domain-containing protein [Verrucomicrobiota bacterium]
MKEEPLIQTDNLGRRFGSVDALTAVNFELRPGRLVALLGENGAGKSTFLKLVAGFLTPDAGRVNPGDDVRIAAMIDGATPPGVMPPGLLVKLQAEAWPSFDSEKAKEQLASHDIPLKKPFSSLSKGQKAWTLAVLTLSQNTPVVLMDEPADGLDTSSRRALYDTLRDRVNEGETSALVATHIIDDIDRVADEVAVISHGKLILHAELEELREEVREIELPANASTESLKDLKLIASRTVGDSQLCTVKSPGGEGEIRSLFPDAITIQPVRLEKLFLSITKPETATESV